MPTNPTTGSVSSSRSSRKKRGKQKGRQPGGQNPRPTIVSIPGATGTTPPAGTNPGTRASRPPTRANPQPLAEGTTNLPLPPDPHVAATATAATTTGSPSPATTLPPATTKPPPPTPASPAAAPATTTAIVTATAPATATAPVTTTATATVEAPAPTPAPAPAPTPAPATVPAPVPATAMTPAQGPAPSTSVIAHNAVTTNTARTATGTTAVTPHPQPGLKSPPTMKHKPSEYNWDDLPSDPVLPTTGPRLFTIPEDFLMDPLPNGFGFNHQCLDWLIKLDIYTWDDFKIQAFFLDVKSLMTNLTVDYYHKYRHDLRKFLSFGTLCNPNLKEASPAMTSLHLWMPTFIKRLHQDRMTQYYSKLEKQAAQEIYNQIHFSSVRPSLFCDPLAIPPSNTLHSPSTIPARTPGAPNTSPIVIDPSPGINHRG